MVFFIFNFKGQDMSQLRKSEFVSLSFLFNCNNARYARAYTPKCNKHFLKQSW